MIDDTSHPICLIELLNSEYGSDTLYEFSKYVYEPQQLFEKRTTFQASGKVVSVRWLEELLNALEVNEEIAIHSKVQRKGKTFHIPMIDFCAESWDVALLSELRKYLPTKALRELVVYSSGRSFHGYSASLVTPGEWREFMGRLLLVNQPGQDQWVDSRWIGHRLVGGFSSLRWSYNTAHYKSLPKLFNYVLSS